MNKTLLSDGVNIGKFRLYVNYFPPQDVLLMLNGSEKCCCKRGGFLPMVAHDVDIVLFRDLTGILEPVLGRPFLHASNSQSIMTRDSHPRYIEGPGKDDRH